MQRGGWEVVTPWTPFFADWPAHRPGRCPPPAQARAARAGRSVALAVFPSPRSHLGQQFHLPVVLALAERGWPARPLGLPINAPSDGATGCWPGAHESVTASSSSESAAIC